MVKIREDQPLHIDGSVDIEMWLSNLNERVPGLDMSLIRRVCAMSERAEAEAVAANNIWAPGKSSYRTGLEMADILVELGLDQESLVAAIIYRAVREGKLTLDVIHREFGSGVAELIEGILRMAVISNIQLMATGPVFGQLQDQVEQARKLLVSLVDDVRVALIKLAERTCAIRAIAVATPEKRIRLAHEIFDIYAPLAHRLGIGHLKWELEDLSFRYIEPEAYKQIAELLDGKRLDRQRDIDAVIRILEQKLAEVGIKGTIYGRAKHIYSIWRKMKEKGISFSQVYDVRAVRVLVPEVNDCYQALGAVHSLWHNIPQEFDDYIANPKENGYRSLHTAVIGPEGKILEVQIRTYDMHEDAELGVCSHWQYKSALDAQGRHETPRVEKGERSYEEKINWLRQILIWQEDLGDSLGLAKDILEEINLDRIYVFTPEGHVIDLIPGATPLDFAYRVHTEIGHRSRGARVNDQIVPLNHTLKSGDRVEIITSSDAIPRREWLFEHLGYLRTSRARAKVQSWFRRRDRSKNIADGREVLDTELHHLGVHGVDYARIAHDLDIGGQDDLLAAVGAGDLEMSEVIEAIRTQVSLEEQGQLDFTLVERDREDEGNRGARVTGTGNMDYEIAMCCLPTPNDPILGLIDHRSVVQIHRRDCQEALQNDTSSNHIAVHWRQGEQDTFPVDVVIRSYDRAGLLYDITSVLGVERVNMRAIRTDLDRAQNRVDLHLTLEVASLDTLLKLLERIERIPNVIEATRDLAQAG